MATALQYGVRMTIMDATDGPNDTGTSASSTREEALKFLESLTQFLGAYHNHKEASAWASVGVFVLAAGQLLQHRISYTTLANSTKLALALLSVVLCGVTILFMHKQFALRRQAAQRAAACFRIRCKLIATPGQSLEPAAFVVPQGEFLPQIVLDDVRELGLIGTASVTDLERAAYVLVSLMGFGIIIRLLA
jgi:hypothetical protein